MAWPYDALYHTFAALDVVTHEQLNAPQTEINNLCSGTRNLTGAIYSATEATGTRPGTGATKPWLYFPTEPTVRQLISSQKIGTSQYLRYYALDNGGWEKTINAAWDDGGSQWSLDDAAKVASSDRVFTSGTTTATYTRLIKASGSGAWADGSWTTVFTTDINGAVTAASAITATTGNVTATSGQVVAAGTVAGASGPGLLKGKRLYSTGTALNAAGTDFTIGAGWGNTATAAVTGTDMAGSITVTANGAGIAANPTLTLLYKDGTFTNTTEVMCVMANCSTASDMAPAPYTPTDTTFALTYLSTPTAGRTYTFRWQVTGR